MTIPEGFAQITHFFSGANLPNGAAITYGVDQAAGNSAADVALQAILALNESTLIDGFTNDQSVILTRAKLGPDATGPTGEVTNVVAGQDTAAPSPPNVAVLIRKVTGSGGRAHRGRFFIPGVGEDKVQEDGDILSTFRTAVQTDATAFLAALSTRGIPMVVLHDPPQEWFLDNGVPRRRPVPGAPTPAPTPVTALVVDGLAATQRRRLRG